MSTLGFYTMYTIFLHLPVHTALNDVEDSLRWSETKDVEYEIKRKKRLYC